MLSVTHVSFPASRGGVSNLPILCGVLLALLAGSATAATQATLPVRVADVTVPAGGVAQIQVFLDRPHTLLSGEIVMDLDPAVFGDVLWTDVFSATGDQVGSATATNGHLDVFFRSQTASIGRLPGLPVMVVSVPVRASAVPGTKSAMQVKAGKTATWVDSQNIFYTVNGVAGTLTVGGTLSVKDVQPGGGARSKGTAIKIEGTGFVAGTSVTIEGVAHSAARFVSASEVDVTLDGPTELTGKRVIVSNPGGESVTFFSALRPNVVHRPTDPTFAAVQPITPLQLYTDASTGTFGPASPGVAVENPGAEPVDVLIRAETGSIIGATYGTPTTFTLAPGAMYIESAITLGEQDFNARLSIFASAPIRAMWFDPRSGGAVVFPIPNGTTQILPMPDGSNELAPSVGWAVRVAAGRKIARVLNVITIGESVPFTVSLEPGANWLSLSSSSGSTCIESQLRLKGSCPASSQLLFTFDASGLNPGVYHANLTFTPQGYNPIPTTTPVVLTVDSQPLIFTDVGGVSFGPATANDRSGGLSFNVGSNAEPLGYSVSIHLPAGETWLTTDVAKGVTPSQVNVSGVFKGLAPGHYAAIITIQGPNNSIDLPVAVDVIPDYAAIFVSPNSVNLALQAGSGIWHGTISTPTIPELSASETTSDGGGWLSVSIASGGAGVAVNVNPVGLGLGGYHGTITLTAPGVPTTVVLVTLAIYDVPPAIRLSAPSVVLTAEANGKSVPQIVTVSTGSLPVSLTVSIDQPWLGAVAVDDNLMTIGSPTTPTKVYIAATALGLAPGVYTGNVLLTAPAGSSNQTMIPVTLIVIPTTKSPTPQQGPAPVVSSILNGASQRDGSLAPGEIVTIFGQNIGPATPAGFAYGADGKVATMLGGVEVRFDGKASPLLYASVGQLNAIVPYEVSGGTSVEVFVNGTGVGSARVPVAVSAPGVFTLDSSGVGAGAVLNQDGTVNASGNPADRGAAVQIFLTGAGAVMPAAMTGEITGSPGERVAAPVSVTIGGVDASVVYAGAAPGAVSGLVQVNAVVPASVGSGVAPVVVRVGDVSSIDGVTVVVR